MPDLTFYILDVFAEEKFAGNQLAVFRGGASLSSKEMQCLAREMNYSETTFIISETERLGGYDVRIFTPMEEVPFAGHPTLGTAHILRHEVLQKPVAKVVLNLPVGQIPVTFEEDGCSWMNQVEPVMGKRYDPAMIASVLSLEPDEIDDRFPIEEVSTGLPFTIVPLKKLASLQRARIRVDQFFPLIKDAWAKGILIFCPEAHSQTDPIRARDDAISVRVFVDYFGIPEDPATGSGNGCLAGYLVKHRYWGSPTIDVCSEQGFEIGRPSFLYLKASEQDEKINIFVGGRSVTVAKGQFLS